VVCKSQQGEKYKDVIWAHMGIWRRPCAQMMILFGIGVSDVEEGERGKSQNLRPTQGKWSSTTLDGPQPLRYRQAEARHIKISPCCIACLTRGTNFSFKQDPFAGSQTWKTIRESVQHGCLIQSTDRIESVVRTSLSKMVLGDGFHLKISAAMHQIYFF
jgi:hypothetical protein